MKTSGCGFVKMEEVGWCLGPPAGVFFLVRNWLIYQVRGPGMKQEEKIFRTGRPGSATPDKNDELGHFQEFPGHLLCIQKECMLLNFGFGDGQGGLACCSPWGHKELDMTE